MSMCAAQEVTVESLYDMFRKYRKRFFFSVVFFGVGASVVWFMQPAEYSVSVLVDIARIGVPEQTRDYTYDTYYRLQADEQFAETVAQWLRVPRVVDDILQTATLPAPDTLRARERFFQAHRISPQSIAVKYSVANPLIGERIAKSMQEQLTMRITSLNYGAVQSQWFVAQVSAPVIARKQLSLWAMVVVGGVVGSVVGSVAVFLGTLRQGSHKRRARRKRG